ncbi:MAG: zf-HC2 domain-containing protein [Firmicutes bacterium]|nr:zf-HC2 domain-containing protein [Bacillota bacterium]
MDCKEILNLIDYYHEDKLNEIQKMKVDKHLKECKSCKEEYREMENIFKALKTQSDFISPPSDFTEKLMNKVNKEEKLKKIKRIKRIKRITTQRWGLSFVAAGLLVMFLNFTTIGDMDILSKNIYNETYKINKTFIRPLSKISQIIDRTIDNLSIDEFKK